MPPSSPSLMLRQLGLEFLFYASPGFHGSRLRVSLTLACYAVAGRRSTPGYLITPLPGLQIRRAFARNYFPLNSDLSLSANSSINHKLQQRLSLSAQSGAAFSVIQGQNFSLLRIICLRWGDGACRMNAKACGLVSGCTCTLGQGSLRTLPHCQGRCRAGSALLR